MDEERQNALSDAALDRALEDALRVEPSPEFLARVRTRLAQEPAREGWRVSWRVAFAGTAVVVVALVVVSAWPRSDAIERRALVRAPAAEPVLVTTPGSQMPAHEAPAPPQPSRVVAAPQSARVGTPHRASARVEPQPARTPFDAVVVSPDEQRAFESLVVAVQEGRLPPLPPVTGEGEGEPLAPAPLEIEPLVIEPLPQVARLE